MEVNSQPHVPACCTSEITTTGTNGIAGRVGARASTDFWKINTSHASTWILSPDRLARKLAARLNTLFPFCPHFTTCHTSAYSHTHCFNIMLLQKTGKRLGCWVYSYAKASQLKKFNYGRVDFAEICYKRYTEKDFLTKYDELATSVVKRRKGACVERLCFDLRFRDRPQYFRFFFPFLGNLFFDIMRVH